MTFLLLALVATLTSCSSSSLSAHTSKPSSHQGEVGEVDLVDDVDEVDEVNGESAADSASNLGASAPTESARSILEAHNRFRGQHCADPLRWSDELASIAQAWANQLRDRSCSFGHSQGREYGENLYFAAPSNPTSGVTAVDTWYTEHQGYRFESPGFSMQTGHFTQVVWRGSRELGCGLAQCNGGDLWVCNYSPPGNMMDAFRENVLPTSCR